MRLIDVDAVIKVIDKHTFDTDDGLCLDDDITCILEEVPSAETEIVRCKDCKYYVIHTLFGRSQAWCERLCDEFDKSLAHGVESDDYCSRAERRTDE